MIGTAIGGVVVLDAKEMQGYIRENRVDVAILSINRDDVQAVANKLIDAGVRAIWNFTEREIDPGSSGVVVESIHFSDSLLALSYYLTEQEQ